MPSGVKGRDKVRYCLHPTLRLLAGSLAVCAMYNCSASSITDSVLSTETRIRVDAGTRDVYEVHQGISVRCQVDGADGPRSYLVADIGHIGVPKLSAAARAVIETIRPYGHRDTLRFLFFGKELVVFDAVYGPCFASSPGYWVLNGACNEYYSPTDNLSGTGAVSGGCDQNVPRPWKSGDPGRRRSPPWIRYTSRVDRMGP